MESQKEQLHGLPQKYELIITNVQSIKIWLE